MAMFFDFPVASPDAYEPLHSQWHPQYPLLAVASKENRVGHSSGSVNLYTDDGEHLSTSTIQRAASPTLIAWHPTKKLLATGWERGEVIMWNEDTHALFECTSMHNSAVTCLTWSHDGSRLFSGDEDGLLCVWRISKTGKATLTNEHHLENNGGFTHCVAISGATDDASMAYLGTTTNAVMLADATGSCSLAFTVGSAIFDMIYDNDSRSLVVATQDLMVTHHKVSTSGDLDAKYEFKLTGKTLTSITWASPGVLAAATGQNLVRFWNSEEGDTFFLGLAEESGDFSINDTIQTVAYNGNNRIIVGTSRNGLAYMWKLTDTACNASECWSFLPPTELKGNLVEANWGPNNLLYVQNSVDTVAILREHIIRKCFSRGVAVVQVSSTRVVVEVLARTSHDLDVDFKIQGVDTDGQCICLWSKKRVVLYELVKSGDVIRKTAEFENAAVCCALLDGKLYTAEGTNVFVRGLQGACEQTLQLADTANVAFLSCNGSFVAAASESGTMRVWDVSRRQAKSIAGPKDASDDIDAITNIAINHTGSHLSFTAKVDGRPDSGLWLWDLEKDSLTSQAFGIGRIPIAQYWDPSDGRLAVVKDGGNKPEVSVLFVSPDAGFIIQGSDPIDDLKVGPLLGVSVPHLFFSLRGKTDEGLLLHKTTMSDFAGLENVDDDTKKSMLEFSYHLTAGDLDAALRSVRGISSDAIWHNMARMCISSKRLDVAAVCMGKLGDAVAARVLRESSTEKEAEARVGALATQLEMYEEAARLYRECGRFDLLNKLLQSQGKWEEAIAVAQEHDRVNLSSTYFKYAKELEALGRLAEAIKYYELSNNHTFEVPRMLFHQVEQLEAYVSRTNNTSLNKWLGQYQEAQEEFGKALESYRRAGDTLSAVRIHCYSDEVGKAKDLVDKTQNKAAAYRLARHYESMGSIEDAISYYSTAGSYNNAIRLAKEHGFKQQMLGLALKSTKADMLSAAEYYESQGAIDKAVTLYHKAGRIARALELCFQHNLNQALSDVAQNLDANTDPELLRKASEFFMQNGQHSRAVSLLIVSKRFDEALDLIEQYNIPLTEAYAEQMTFAKGEVDKALRQELLTRVAGVCYRQGAYQLATKKFTQAGQHVKAMKALLKCGDTNKIIFFANKCRTKEVYVLAANYLQGLDWRRDPDIMTHIVTFYKKGRALDTLATFYESCATIEIDDYQNYDKALGALNEALQSLSRARMKDLAEQERRVGVIQQKIDLTTRFLGVKDLTNKNPSEMMEQAHLLLTEPDINNSVRVGDIYSLMIIQQESAGHYDAAYDLLQQLRVKMPTSNITYYVPMKVVESIHSALNIPLGQGQGTADGDDEIGEDIDAEDV